MQEEMAAMDVVSRAVDRIRRHGRFAEFELSNGIILNIKPVPPLLLQAVNNEFVYPTPPKIFLEDKGREEENPNDPKYLLELEKFEEAHNTAIQDLIFAVGTSVKSVPSGYFKPEEDGWVAQIEFAGKIAGRPIKIAKADEVQRYICWLRLYALESGSDVALAQSLSMQLTGIREGEVEEVIDSFRGLPERRSDTEGQLTPVSQNGNSANRAARRSRT